MRLGELKGSQCSRVWLELALSDPYHGALGKATLPPTTVLPTSSFAEIERLASLGLGFTFPRSRSAEVLAPSEESHIRETFPAPVILHPRCMCPTRAMSKILQNIRCRSQMPPSALPSPAMGICTSVLGGCSAVLPKAVHRLRFCSRSFLVHRTCVASHGVTVLDLVRRKTPPLSDTRAPSVVELLHVLRFMWVPEVHDIHKFGDVSPKAFRAGVSICHDQGVLFCHAARRTRNGCTLWSNLSAAPWTSSHLTFELRTCASTS